MTGPVQDRAGKYMQGVVQTITDSTQPERAMEILLRCSELADQDFSECRTSEQKQKVWSALLSAVHVVIRFHGGDAVACNALFKTLNNAAQKRQGSQDLRSPISPTSKPLEIEWARASIIALIDKYPELLDQTISDASEHLGMDKKQVLKLHENFKGELTGAGTLVDLVKTAKSLIKEFGYKTLKELI
jgi:hypothetical protein